MTVQMGAVPPTRLSGSSWKLLIGVIKGNNFDAKMSYTWGDHRPRRKGS